jgi:hypothetical protein
MLPGSPSPPDLALLGDLVVGVAPAAAPAVLFLDGVPGGGGGGASASAPAAAVAAAAAAGSAASKSSSKSSSPKSSSSPPSGAVSESSALHGALAPTEMSVMSEPKNEMRSGWKKIWRCAWNWGGGRRSAL